MIVFIARLYKVGFNPTFFLLDQTNVSISRNQLAGYFLEAHLDKGSDPYNIALWIDSDQSFDFNQFMKLLHHYDEEEEVDILSARYITRDLTNPRVCAFNSVEDEEGIKFSAITPDNIGIVEVDSFGFGYVMMNPDVLEEMYSEYGLHQFCFRAEGNPLTGDILGEDMDWCIKAKKIGYKLYVDNDVSIGHVGGMIDDRILGIVK